MLVESAVFQKLSQDLQLQVEEILAIANQEIRDPDLLALEKVMHDCFALYQGLWPHYQACQTEYHNVQHAIEVALVSARIASGYNNVEKKKLPALSFSALIISSLFHDTGYIKAKNDSDGCGGKYTFTHVGRSIKITREYLDKHNFSREQIDTITAAIQATDYFDPKVLKTPSNSRFTQVVSSIVATADLIAQMADVNYLQRIRHLFLEFEEAYRFHGTSYLKDHEIYQYSSASEMIEKTVEFYKEFVLPRMELLGRKDKYLITFFGEGRNPYLENITANLSGKLRDPNVQWRRIGDILQDFGVVNRRQITDALAILKNFQRKNGQLPKKDVPFRKKFLSWLDGKRGEKNLGDVLIETQVVDPSLLRKGLIDQILPQSLMGSLTSPEMLFLLQTSIMLHNISKDHWVFEQILLLANELIKCEASSILLANPDSKELVIAVSTAAKREFYLGRTIPQDKGLSGWVFLKDRPAIVDNIETDERFDVEIDRRFHFEPRNVLTVPLHANGNPIGVLEFLNKKEGSFQQRDIQLMTLFANVIAMSLNAVLRLTRS